MGIQAIVGIAQLGLGLASLGEQQKAAKATAKAQDINRRSTIRAAAREAQIKGAQMRALAGAQGITSGTYSPNPLTTQFGQQAGTTNAIGLNNRAAGLHMARAGQLSGLSDMIGGLGGLYERSQEKQ